MLIGHIAVYDATVIGISYNFCGESVKAIVVIATTEMEPG